MKLITNFHDGLKNLVANLGTSRDKASHSHYVVESLTPSELLAAYRSSWLAKAIVDYPAEDSTRKWRVWRADSDQITQIERLERELGVQRRVHDALVTARLYGGAAIYINTDDADQSEPLSVGTEIKSLVVLSNNSLSAGEKVRDIYSPYYGRPEYYTLTSGADSNVVSIHASRLVIFRGSPLPDGAVTTSSWGGDSVLQSTLDSIKQVDATMANIASLVFESKVDVFKFEGFARMMAENQDDIVLRRAHLNAAMKGINGAVVIDKQDEYEQKSATFSGLPEIVVKFQEGVSGASGIPVTRLYGRSAAGLSGTGEGDERVYYDRIGHDQANEIQPEMALLDDCLIYQALGSRPEEIYFEWVPLKQLTESERADIFQKTATAARSLAGTSTGTLIPIDALSDALVNEITEQGVLPGLDQKVLEYGSLREQDGFVGDIE